MIYDFWVAIYVFVDKNLIFKPPKRAHWFHNPIKFHLWFQFCVILLYSKSKITSWYFHVVHRITLVTICARLCYWWEKNEKILNRKNSVDKTILNIIIKNNDRWWNTLQIMVLIQSNEKLLSFVASKRIKCTQICNTIEKTEFWTKA